MPRLQFTLRALLVLLLAVACFFGGIRFEREWRRRHPTIEDVARELEKRTGGPIDARDSKAARL